MNVTKHGRLAAPWPHLAALVGLVVGCIASPLSTPVSTKVTSQPAVTTASNVPSSARATDKPAPTFIPSVIATELPTATKLPSPAPPTRTPDVRCEEPVVDPADQLDMKSHVLDEADTTTAAVPFEDALLVSGWLAESDGGTAAIWRSDDGTSWQRFESDVLGTGHIFDLLEADSGLLAVGGDLGPSDLGDARIWSSADGVRWQDVHSPALELGGHYGSAYRIGQGGPGYVVVGSQHDFSEVNVAVWLSSDGVTWEVVPPVEAFHSAFPTSLLVRDDGLIVVAVSICGETGCTNGAVLTSSDGRSWERYRESDGPAESITPALHAFVEAGPRELLGVGTSYEDVPLVEVNDVASGVWRSADARTWEVTAGPQNGRALTVANGRFFASGSWGAECQRQNPSVWSSTDGRDWRPAWASADGGTIERMSSWQGRLVMIGSVPDFEAQAFRSTLWVESP